MEKYVINVEPGWLCLSGALEYAFGIHAQQVRRGSNTPYIGHLLSVAGLVLEYGGDETQAVAGVLHDVVEDHGNQHQETILTLFGQRVLDIVLGCTDHINGPKLQWRSRKETYIASLETKSPDILLVSACDKLHNARAILSDAKNAGLSVFDRFAGKMHGTIWYYDTLADSFLKLLPGALANELADTVRAIHEVLWRINSLRSETEITVP